MAEQGVPTGYSERLYNEDLAPVKERTWTAYSLFAMWMADVHSIGGYTFAAGLFFLGLTGWQVFLALLVGITAVYFLMNLTGIAGQRHGVPYPVLSRLSFGLFGANIPALIRAIIAIFWYGIQTWLASVAVVILLLRIFPGLEGYAQNSILGLSTLGWICFLILWGAQLLVLRHGMETVRRFVDWAGPAIYVAMFALAVWIMIESGGHIDFSLGSKELTAGGTLLAFLTAASLVVAYFSTLLLNFCDFSRFSPSERMVKVGNFWGLPVNFTAFSLVTVIVTAGSVAVYGEAITDPVELVAKLPNTFVLIAGAVTFAVATVGINIVAQLRLARLRPGQRRPQVHRLQARRPDHRPPRPPRHALEHLQQPRGRELLPGRPGSLPRTAVRHHRRGLLPGEAGTHRRRRPLPDGRVFTVLVRGRH